jgi:hypothetical protein
VRINLRHFPNLINRKYKKHRLDAYLRKVNCLITGIHRHASPYFMSRLLIGRKHLFKETGEMK